MNSLAPRVNAATHTVRHLMTRPPHTLTPAQQRLVDLYIAYRRIRIHSHTVRYKNTARAAAVAFVEFAESQPRDFFI